MTRVISTIYAIWHRELIRFVREKTRWLGMIMQPLLYLLLVGNGIAASMNFRQVPSGAQIDYLVFMYPGIIGMSVLFTSIFSGVSIIWEREFGFLKEVLVAPAPRWAVAVGKALGIATVVVFQVTVLLFLAPLAGIALTLPGAIKLLFISALLGFTFGNLGIAIAARMQTVEGFHFIMNFMTMPMFFLSGALFPVQGAPPWLKVLMQADPLTYGVDALRNVIYEGRWVAQFLIQHSLGLNLTVIATLALITAAVAAWSFSHSA